MTEMRTFSELLVTMIDFLIFADLLSIIILLIVSICQLL